MAPPKWADSLGLCVVILHKFESVIRVKRAIISFENYRTCGETRVFLSENGAPDASRIRPGSGRIVLLILDLNILGICIV
jgi:hypothetical protein